VVSSKQDFLKQVKHSIEQKDKHVQIYLFGSKARGDDHKNSDWDFLVLTDKKKITYEYEMNLRELVYDLELQLSEVISLMIYSRGDWNSKKEHSRFFKTVEKEGIVI